MTTTQEQTQTQTHPIVGQQRIIELIDSLLSPDTPLPHTLLHGPVGTGKTTIANYIATKQQQQGSSLVSSSGPMIRSNGDIIKLLLNLKPQGVIFIDEIHSIPSRVQEVLYYPLEQGTLEITAGLTKQLPPFTMIAATTNPAKLSDPLRSRFPLVLRVDPYSEDDLSFIASKKAPSLTDDAASNIAAMANGVPRNVSTLIQVLLANYKNETTITTQMVSEVALKLGLNSNGLREEHLKYIKALHTLQHASLSTLASALNEDISTITDIIEPPLIRMGIVRKTSKGRSLV